MENRQEKILLVARRESTIHRVRTQFESEKCDPDLATWRVIDLPDLPAAWSGIKAGEYQIALLDTAPGECFLQPLKDLKVVHGHLPVIVMADAFDDDMILSALSQGALECVSLEDEIPAEIPRAVKRALTRKQAQTNQEINDGLLVEAINAIPHPLYIIDVEDYTVPIGNEAAGYDRSPAPIQCYALTHNQDVPCSGLEHDCPLPQVLATGQPQSTRHVHANQNEAMRVVEVFGYPIRDENGNIKRMVEYAMDITERLAEEERENIRVEEQTRLAAKVYDSTSEGIIITNSAGEIISVNQAFSKITGYAAEEAIGKTPSLLKSGRHDEDFYARMWASLNDTGQWRGEIWNRRKDGDIYPEWLTISAVKNDQDEIINYMAIFIDISQRIQNEELLKFLATHDPLTNIPNRALFKDRVVRALARSQRNHQKVAILMLDLDEFKSINDRFGHAAGDLVLQNWSERLKSSVRESDTVARIGGDEFSIILEGITSKEDARTVVEKILFWNEEPYSLNSHQAYLTTSIGITLYPDDGEDYDELLDNADRAMYVAKANGKNDFSFFSRENRADH